MFLEKNDKPSLSRLSVTNDYPDKNWLNKLYFLPAGTNPNVFYFIKSRTNLFKERKCHNKRRWLIKDVAKDDCRLG